MYDLCHAAYLSRCRVGVDTYWSFIYIESLGTSEDLLIACAHEDEACLPQCVIDFCRLETSPRQNIYGDMYEELVDSLFCIRMCEYTGNCDFCLMDDDAILEQLPLPVPEDVRGIIVMYLTRGDLFEYRWNHVLNALPKN